MENIELDFLIFFCFLNIINNLKQKKKRENEKVKMMVKSI